MEASQPEVWGRPANRVRLFSSNVHLRQVSFFFFLFFFLSSLLFRFFPVFPLLSSIDFLSWRPLRGGWVQRKAQADNDEEKTINGRV